MDVDIDMAMDMDMNMNINTNIHDDTNTYLYFSEFPALKKILHLYSQIFPENIIIKVTYDPLKEDLPSILAVAGYCSIFFGVDLSTGGIDLLVGKDLRNRNKNKKDPLSGKPQIFYGSQFDIFNKIYINRKKFRKGHFSPFRNRLWKKHWLFKYFLPCPPFKNKAKFVDRVVDVRSNYDLFHLNLLKPGIDVTYKEEALEWLGRNIQNNIKKVVNKNNQSDQKDKKEIEIEIEKEIEIESRR